MVFVHSWRNADDKQPVRWHMSVGFLFWDFFFALSSWHANRETHKTSVRYVNFSHALLVTALGMSIWIELWLRNVNTHNKNILYPADGSRFCHENTTENDVLSMPNESNSCFWTVRNVFWSCNNLCRQQDYVHFTGAFLPFSNHIFCVYLSLGVIIWLVGELFLRA